MSSGQFDSTLPISKLADVAMLAIQRLQNAVLSLINVRRNKEAPESCARPFNARHPSNLSPSFMHRALAHRKPFASFNDAPRPGGQEWCLNAQCTKIPTRSTRDPPVVSPVARWQVHRRAHLSRGVSFIKSVAAGAAAEAGMEELTPD